MANHNVTLGTELTIIGPCDMWEPNPFKAQTVGIEVENGDTLTFDSVNERQTFVGTVSEIHEDGTCCLTLVEQ